MTTEAADDFDAAKAIYEKLKDVPQERQEKILRWVRESLGIALPTSYIEKPAPPPPAEDANPTEASEVVLLADLLMRMLDRCAAADGEGRL